MINYIVGLIAIAIVVGVSISFINSAKKGKSSCGSSCSGCASAKNCGSKNKV